MLLALPGEIIAWKKITNHIPLCEMPYFSLLHPRKSSPVQRNTPQCHCEAGSARSHRQQHQGRWSPHLWSQWYLEQETSDSDPGTLTRQNQALNWWIPEDFGVCLQMCFIRFKHLSFPLPSCFFLLSAGSQSFPEWYPWSATPSHQDPWWLSELWVLEISTNTHLTLTNKETDPLPWGPLIPWKLALLIMLPQYPFWILFPQSHQHSFYWPALEFEGSNCSAKMPWRIILTSPRSAVTMETPIFRPGSSPESGDWSSAWPK